MNIKNQDILNDEIIPQRTTRKSRYTIDSRICDVAELIVVCPNCWKQGHVKDEIISQITSRKPRYDKFKNF